MKTWIFSDSHQKHDLLNVPNDIDLAIFAGDAGTYKSPYMNVNGVLDFLMWFRNLPIPLKIMTWGNHDTSVESGLIDKKEFEGITVLNHEYAEVAGLKIFASPYTPSFNNWAFNVARHKLHEYWKDIPDKLDILVTHGPPQGILDLTYSTTDNKPEQCGDKALLNRVKKIQCRYHIFGHIHDEDNILNAGIFKPTGINTTFINASVLNLRYDLVNHGIVIDI